MAVAQLLLANKAAVNAPDFAGWTPLHVADDKNIAALLLALKADVNAKDASDNTPLHKAAQHGHKEVAELLLANKARVNARRGDGKTPLHDAAYGGYKDVAELLLAHNTTFNIFDVTAMDDLERVKSLLKIHPELASSKGEWGITPLHLAAEDDCKDVAELLLANKADVNAKDQGAMTPLHWAAMKGNSGVAECLLAHQADLNAKDKDGRTPLHWAAQEGRADLVTLLLAHNADLDAKEKEGKTPLMLAQEHGREDVVNLLSGRAAPPAATANRATVDITKQSERYYYDGYDLDALWSPSQPKLLQVSIYPEPGKVTAADFKLRIYDNKGAAIPYKDPDGLFAGGVGNGGGPGTAYSFFTMTTDHPESVAKLEIIFRNKTHILELHNAPK